MADAPTFGFCVRCPSPAPSAIGPQGLCGACFLAFIEGATKTPAKTKGKR